jgi:hypothetical protein
MQSAGAFGNSVTACDIEHELTFYGLIYSTADKYLLQDLKELSIRRFCQRYSRYCSKGIEMCEHQANHSCVLTWNLTRIIYTYTPEKDRGLRDIIVTLLLQDYWRLRYHPEKVTAYRPIMLVLPVLCFDMAMLALQKRHEMHEV